MKQAVILAAGEGQRLRPFTATKPKVMLSIADKPILAYVLEALIQSGIRNIILVVGYRREQIFDYISSREDFNIEISYVTQERQLGTAHALAQAKKMTDNEFLVLPGDNLIEPDTASKLISLEPNTMLVKRVDNPLGYGVTDMKDGLAQEISEKPRETKSNIVNTGIYAFTKDIFNFIKQELDIPDVLNTMIAQGCSIRAEEITSTWLDVIYPWDILNLNNIILRQIPPNLSGTIEPGVSLNGPISIGNDTIIRSNTYIAGPAMIGTGCDIGPNVCILHATSIGDNVVISPFTQIRNSAIGNDVNIGPGCSIQDSVIDRGCVIQGHFTASSQETEIKIDAEHHTINIGAMIGEDCHLNSNVVAQPGVIIGNYTRVQALKKISGRLPDHSLVL